MNKTLGNIEIFIGTYDSYLLSYKIKEHNEKIMLQRVIQQNSHTSSVRSVHGVGKFIASGGSDDRIIVMDLKKNQEIQMLTHHKGTVNQVKFSPDGTYLFSASDDGMLAATKTGSWKTDNVWKMPHTGKAITCISIHPSGKLALTLGRDWTMRTWSLIKGRQCFTTNLKNITTKGETIEQVQWSPDGVWFALVAIDKVLIMSVGSAGIVREFPTPSRVLSLCWLDNNTVALGQMNGQLQFVSVVGHKTNMVDVHTNRVKAMAMLHNYLITVSSNSNGGDLAVWRADVADMRLTKVCETTIGRRPVCLDVIDASEWNKIKDEQDEIDAANESLVIVPAVKPLLTTAHVTIENDEVEVYRTQQKRSKKKVKPVESTGKDKRKVTPKRKLSVVAPAECNENTGTDTTVTSAVRTPSKKKRKSSTLTPLLTIGSNASDKPTLRKRSKEANATPLLSNKKVTKFKKQNVSDPATLQSSSKERPVKRLQRSKSRLSHSISATNDEAVVSKKKSKKNRLTL